jgi:cytochrome d ubiquinol oxidase subunit I
VKGLDAFPKDERPPVAATHFSFQVMVGTGSAMALLAVVTLLGFWRKWQLFGSRRYLWTVVACGPLGMIALEAGWLMTEFGRQPWIVRGAMRTSQAVTPFPHLGAPFWTFTLVYLGLGVAVVYLLFRQLRHAQVTLEGPLTVGPVSLRSPDSLPGKGEADDAH